MTKKKDKPDEPEALSLEIVEAETEELAPLVEVADQSVYRTLFRADDPTEILERARQLVAYIDKLIDKRREDYIAQITVSGKTRPYAMNTWWSANDVALGITHNNLPVEPFETAHVDVEAYRDRCELFYADGRLLGSGEAIVVKTEPKPGGGTWDHHELFSKVQTRAFVKANRLSLALLPLLAGLQPISAEEVHEDPIVWPGDEIVLEDLRDDLQLGLKALGWGANKAKKWLAKFLKPDGSLKENEAARAMNSEIDLMNAAREAGEAKR